MAALSSGLAARYSAKENIDNRPVQAQTSYEILHFQKMPFGMSAHLAQTRLLLEHLAILEPLENLGPLEYGAPARK